MEFFVKLKFLLWWMRPNLYSAELIHIPQSVEYVFKLLTQKSSLQLSWYYSKKIVFFLFCFLCLHCFYTVLWDPSGLTKYNFVNFGQVPCMSPYLKILLLKNLLIHRERERKNNLLGRMQNNFSFIIHYYSMVYPTMLNMKQPWWCMFIKSNR